MSYESTQGHIVKTWALYFAMLIFTMIAFDRLKLIDDMLRFISKLAESLEVIIRVLEDFQSFLQINLVQYGEVDSFDSELWRQVVRGKDLQTEEVRHILAASKPIKRNIDKFGTCGNGIEPNLASL